MIKLTEKAIWPMEKLNYLQMKGDAK